MNLYRGCTHGCAYCDGRAETYRVAGDFDKDVEVKSNAIELLKRELDPGKKRKPFEKGFFLVGGGVCDSYQPLERQYRLTRQTLELMLQFNHPVHMLTKSTLITEDIHLLKEINRNSKAIVSMSFSSVDNEISKIFEPGVSPPEERLKCLQHFKQNGIATGMFLMPVIPFITDTPQMIERAVKAAKRVGVDFIIFGGMTLKDGRQKEHFMNVITEHYPQFSIEYDTIYANDKWGNTIPEYYQYLNQIFLETTKKYSIATRIPSRLYNRILSINDLAVVMLEHLDYAFKLSGNKSPYRYAAYQISKLNTPLTELRDNLRSINGIGKFTAQILKEIIDYRNSSYYDRIMNP